MKYALIGCGRISNNHIFAAIKNQLEIVGICDVVQSRVDQKATEHHLNKLTRRYYDYREMLEKECPDFVAVCTESGKHSAIAIDCLDAGCNVLIEKPIALSIADADSIIDKVKRTGLKAGTCHQNRFNASIQRARREIDKGSFGKLLYGTAQIRWNRSMDYYQQAEWRGTWEQDGGALMNQCIHNIDLLRWMMGGKVLEVIGAIANQNHPYIKTEDFGVAIVRFENDTYGIIEGTTNTYPSNLEETLSLFGQNGTVEIGGESVNRILTWRVKGDEEKEEEIMNKYYEAPPNVYGFGHNLVYKDMIEAIIDNRQPYITVQDGKEAVELVLGIYKSHKERRIIKMPVRDFSSEDMRTTFGR